MNTQHTPTMQDAIDAGNGTLHGAIDYWQGEAEKYKQQRDELRDALKNYGRHKYYCCHLRSLDPCDCGLYAAFNKAGAV